MPSSYNQVDEQVVKMTFNNSNFDSNIDKSIMSLNKLDDKLGSLSRSDNLNILANNFKNAFDIRNLIKIGFFTSLGNEIFKLGKKIKNSLVKGIQDGRYEYKLLIDSTQTIYENVKQSGKTLDDVNKALDELNEYADKTVYNFSEMTRMIGMFTSAGVGLNNSVKTIKGLANAAALVGANSQKAEMAWRAVSRAMSSGRFTLLTWKTLEQSNIAGKQFQEVIKDVARAHKINIDKMIKKQGSFRDTLKKGWLDNNIFSEAMKIMSGDMDDSELRAKGYSEKQIKKLRKIADSAVEAATRVKTFKQLLETTSEAIGSGWAQSFRILVGDLEQARKIYTRISEVINDFIDNNANIRNELFTKIMDFKDKELYGSWKSGRDNFVQTIENVLATIKTFLKTLKTGFLNVFPVDRIAAGARKVLDIIQRFTRIFVINSGKVDKAGKTLWNTSAIDNMTESVKDLIKFFRGLFAIIDIAWMAISRPIETILKRIPIFKDFFNNAHNSIIDLINQLGKFGDKIELFREAAEEFDIFGASINYLLDNFDEIAKNNPIIKNLVSVFERLKDTILDLKDAFDKLEVKPLTVLFGTFKIIVNGLLIVLNKLATIVSDLSSKVDWSWLETPKKIFGDIIKTLDAYGKGLITFEEATKDITEFFKQIWNNLFNTISKIPFGQILDGTFNGLSKTFSGIVKIVNGIFGSFNAKISKNDGIVTVLDKANEACSGIEVTLNNTNSTISNLSKSIDNVGNGIKLLTSPLEEMDTSIEDSIDNIEDTLEDGKENIKKEIKDTGKEAASTAQEAAGKVSKSVAERIKNSPLAKIPAFFANVFGKISSSFGDVTKKLALLGGGVAVAALSISSLIKTVKKIEIFNGFTRLLGAGVDVLKAYERQVQTKAILNLAITIGILASVMITMAFIPYDKIENGLVMFTSFISVLGIMLPPIITAMAKFNESIANINKSKITGPRVPLTNFEASFGAMSNVLNNLINNYASVAKEFAKGFNTRMLGKAFKDIALSVLILVGAIVLLKYTISIDELKEYGIAITQIVGLITAAVLTLTIAARAFTKKAKDLASSVNVFSAFFTLSGVAAVILAIAAATFVLSKSLIMLSKENPNDLKAAVDSYLWIFGTLAATMVIMTALSRGANSTGKLKKITLSITGALLGLAVVFSVLSKIGDPTNLGIMLGGMTAIFVALAIMMGIIGKITIPDNLNKLTTFVGMLGLVFATLAGSIALVGVSLEGQGNPNKWVGILTTLGGLFVILSASIIPLVEVAKHVGNDPGVWTRLQVTVVVMANAMLAIAGSIAILGRTPKIPSSAFALFGIMIGAIGGIIAVAAAVTSAGGIFSDNFVRVLTFIGVVVTSISLSIAASVAAMTAIVNAFNKIDIATEDIGKTSKNITDKLSMAGVMIMATLPQVVDLFSKVGLAAGEIFISFTKSFVERIAEMGDQYAQLADRIVTVALDIAGKVVNVLYSRKEELAVIVRKGLSVISGVISAAINQIFNGEEGSPAIKESTVSKWLGFGTILLVVGSFATKIITILKGLGSVVSTVWAGISKVITAMTAGAATSTAQIAFYFVALVVAIVGAYTALTSAFHGIKQMEGEEAAYHNANINTIGKSIESLFTNIEYRRQVLIYGFAFLGRFILTLLNSIIGGVIGAVSRSVQVILTIITKPYELLLRFWGLFDKTYKDKADKLKMFVNSFGEVADNSFKGIATAWKNIGNFEIGDNNWEAYKEKGENITKGVAAGLSDYDDTITGIISKGDSDAINTIAGDWDINSPSKVAEKLYGNVVKGAAKGLKDGSKTLRQVFHDNNMAMVSSIRNLNFEVKDSNGGTKTLELNRQLLELTEKQTDAIVGKSREEVYAYLKEKANILGLMNAETKAAELTAAIFSQQQDQTKLKLQSINAVTEATKVSVETIVGDQIAANALVLQDTLKNSLEMSKIASDHASELVGLDKKKAQELLKNEAIARGMDEQAAEESSKKMTALIFANQKNKKKITIDGVKNAAKIMDDEVDAYKATLEKETAALQDALTARAKMHEESGKKMAKGEYKDISSMLADLRTVDSAYEKAKAKYNEAVNAIGKDLKDEKYISNDYFENQYKKALNALNKSKATKSYTGVISGFINKLKNGVTNALNLDSWKNMFNNNNNNNNNKDDNNKNAVNKAKDLKNDLEKNRADLTPTIDLDRLSNEAKKANGIVTSSLMAAQNASIGDYINKDSELNPFMKDRWQNVYNFTQNNYSPKALSRIDIYRQTQRQISMSRGF